MILLGINLPVSQGVVFLLALEKFVTISSNIESPLLSLSLPSGILIKCMLDGIDI